MNKASLDRGFGRCLVMKKYAILFGDFMLSVSAYFIVQAFEGSILDLYVPICLGILPSFRSMGITHQIEYLGLIELLTLPGVCG